MNICNYLSFKLPKLALSGLLALGISLTLNTFGADNPLAVSQTQARSIAISMTDVGTGGDFAIAPWRVVDLFDTVVLFSGMGSTSISSVPFGFYCFESDDVPGYTKLAEDGACKFLPLFPLSGSITFGASYLSTAPITGTIAVAMNDLTAGGDKADAGWRILDTPGGTTLFSGVGSTVIDDVPTGNYCLEADPVEDYIQGAVSGCLDVMASATTVYSADYTLDPTANKGTIEIVSNLDSAGWSLFLTSDLITPAFVGVGTSTLLDVPEGEYLFVPDAALCYDFTIIGLDTQTLIERTTNTYEVSYSPHAGDLDVRADITEGTWSIYDGTSTEIATGTGDTFLTHVLPLPDIYTLSFNDVPGYDTPADMSFDATACAFVDSAVGDYLSRDLELSLLLPDDSEVAPGDRIIYRIEYRNVGEADVTNVQVRFDYNEEFEEIVSAPGWSELTPGVLTQSLPSPFEPGLEPIVLQVEVQVKSTTPDSTVYDVSAEITSTDGDNEIDMLNNEKTATITVAEANESRMKKRVTNLSGDGIPGTLVKATEGDVLLYYLGYMPETDETGYVFSDDLFDVLEYADIVDIDGNPCADPEVCTPYGGGSVVGTVMSWPAMDIAACPDPQAGVCGVEVGFKVQIKSGLAGIAGDYRATNSFGKDVTVVTIPSLELNKSGSVNGATPALTGSAQPGDTIKYLLSATNNGQADFQGFVFQDNLEEVLLNGGEIVSEIVDAQTDGAYTLANNIISWSPVTVAAGETVTRSFTVQIVNPLASREGLKLRNVYGDVVTEFVVVDLALSKAVYNESRDPDMDPDGTNTTAAGGNNLEYVLTMTNTNTVASFDGFIPRDDISDLIPYIYIDSLDISDGGTFDAATGVITWPVISSIAPSETVTRTFKVILLIEPLWPTNVDKVLTNTFGNRVDVNLEGAQDRVDLAIDKSADKEGLFVTDGDDIRYTLEFWNEGKLDATNVRIVDDFDETKISIDPLSITGGGELVTVSGNEFIEWTASDLGTVTGNSISSIFLNYDATAISSGDNEDIVNTVLISSDQVELDNSDNTDTVLVRLNSEPITIVKSVDQLSIGSGTAVYRIVVENTTDEPQSGVLVTDNITSGGITYTNGGSVTFAGGLSVSFEPGSDGDVGSFTGDLASGIILDDIPGRRSVTIEYTAEVSNTGVPDDDTSVASNTATIDYRIGIRDYSDSDEADITIIGLGASEPGTITITTNEPGAVFAASGPAVCSGMGTSKTCPNMPAGSYTVVYNAIFGLVPPLSETKVLAPGGSISFDGLYTSSGDGIIEVTTNLDEAVFTISSSTGSFPGMGMLNTFDPLPAGNYTVTFDPVTGYVTPASQSVALSAGETAMVNALYLLEPEGEFGTVVILNNIPGGAADVTCESLGAGPITYATSGVQTEITMVKTGTCSVVWKDAVGFSTPETQLEVLKKDETLTFTGTYGVITTGGSGGSSGGGGGGTGIGGVKVRNDEQELLFDHLVSLDGENFEGTQRLEFGESYNLVYTINITNNGDFAAKNIELSSVTNLNGTTTSESSLLAGVLGESDFVAVGGSDWNIGLVAGVSGASFDPVAKTFVVDSINANDTKTVKFSIPVTTGLSGNQEFSSTVTLNGYDIAISPIEDNLKRMGIGLKKTAVAYTGLLALKDPNMPIDAGAFDTTFSDNTQNDFSIDSEGIIFSMSANKSAVAVGDVVDFVITLENTSNRDFTELMLNSDYSVFLDPITEGLMDDGLELHWSKAIFAAGEKLEYRFQARAKNNFTVDTIAKVLSKFMVDEVDPDNLPVALLSINGLPIPSKKAPTPSKVAPARAARMLPATGMNDHYGDLVELYKALEAIRNNPFRNIVKLVY